MKQNLKRVLLVLCMVTCLFSLSACSQAETEESNVDVNLAMALEQQSQLVFGQFAALPAEQIELAKAMAEQSEQDVLVGGYESWANVQNDLGAFVSVDGTETRISEDSYMVDVRATFEKRAMTFTVGWSEEGEAMMVSSISITPDYTLNEKMEKAAMNTLMGMGTVFLVLIFISLIIGSLKYVNAAGANTKPEAAPAAAPAPVAAAPVAAVPANNLMNDLELVAVITAAIAASTGTSADGLVVRSIKRKSGSTWKRN